MNNHRHYKFGTGRPWIGTALASLMLTATACGAPPQDNESRPVTQAVIDDTGTRTHIVEIRQFKFTPQTLTVKDGDTIIWRNLDVVPHTATDRAQQWNSGNLRKNEEWSMVANGAGQLKYFCAYHPSMKGTVIIESDQEEAN